MRSGSKGKYRFVHNERTVSPEIVYLLGNVEINMLNIFLYAKHTAYAKIQAVAQRNKRLNTN